MLCKSQYKLLKNTLDYWKIKLFRQLILALCETSSGKFWNQVEFWKRSYVHQNSGVTGPKPRQVHFKDFWSHTLEWWERINMINIIHFLQCLLIWVWNINETWVYPFSTYAKFSEKLTFLTPWCAYQGVRNVSFSENFAYVLNGWSPYLRILMFDNNSYQKASFIFLPLFIHFFRRS